VGGPLRSPSHVASPSAGVATLGSVVDGSLRPLRSAPTACCDEDGLHGIID
jgi:hypothetical protein